MARKEARITTSVWRNPSITSLPLAAQGLYWMLLAQPDVSMCGVLPYLPSRWRSLCGSDDMDEALATLEESGAVVVDRDTLEVLIRTFVKHDGVVRSPKTRQPMWKSWEGVLSDRIRTVVLEQVSEHVDEAIREGWTTRQDIETARRNGVPDTPPDTPSEQGGDTPSATPPDRAGTPTTAPTTATAPSAGGAREALAAAISTACRQERIPPPGTRSHQQLEVAAADIAALGGQPHEVPGKAREFRRQWPDATLTPMALAKHWLQLVPETVDSRPEAQPFDPNHGLRAAGLTGEAKAS